MASAFSNHSTTQSYTKVSTWGEGTAGAEYDIDEDTLEL